MMRTSLLILATLLASSLFAAGHDLTTSPPNANQLRPAVTGNGSGFTAAWIEPVPNVYSRNLVVSQAVSAAGEPIAGAGAAVDQPTVWGMAIAHSPSETVVVWIDGNNVYAERLSPSGALRNTILVSSGHNTLYDVAVAWNGSRYFVIWSTASQLFGAFIALDGSSTAPRPFFTEPSPQTRETSVAPDVAWDGQQFVVVFGERPVYSCNILCPVPIPEQFRVMRLSADGDAIDSSPLVITGSHLRAHVASSGAESLIALDGLSEASTIVAHTEGGLTLDAETPIFRWVTEMSSAVVWDGATFRVGWRYAGADVSWIGAASVTRSGQPFDYRFTPTGGVLPYGGTISSGRPSIAVNDAGITAFTISEASASSPLARARLYFASEFAPMPAPPSVPRNVISYFGGNTARIDWQSDDVAAGFAIDAWAPYSNSWYVFRIVPGDARTFTVYTSIGALFRVRALGPGGMSDGTITSIGSMQRRRAERH